MVFAMSQRPLVLNEEEQKILKAFGRTSFSRKSNLAIESLLTPAQVDVAANHLAEKGLVKIKSSKNSFLESISATSKFVFLTNNILK